MESPLEVLTRAALMVNKSFIFQTGNDGSAKLDVSSPHVELSLRSKQLLAARSSRQKQVHDSRLSACSKATTRARAGHPPSSGKGLKQSIQCLKVVQLAHPTDDFCEVAPVSDQRVPSGNAGKIHCFDAEVDDNDHLEPLNLSKRQATCMSVSKSVSYTKIPATVTTSAIDPAIEEHFRRSLGQRYGLKKDPDSCKMPDDIAASVDDHFQKSLGKEWLKSPECHTSLLNTSAKCSEHLEQQDIYKRPHEKKNAMCDEQKRPLRRLKGSVKCPKHRQRQSPKSGCLADDCMSVDDHFARALGEKWEEIQRSLVGTAACRLLSGQGSL